MLTRFLVLVVVLVLGRVFIPSPGGIHPMANSNRRTSLADSGKRWVRLGTAFGVAN
jgi:hypothetical protein